MIENTGKFRITAKTLFGLEEVLAEEIQKIGGEEIELLNRAVSFIGSKETLYRANLEIRTAIKILVPIVSFEVFNEVDLYRETKNFDWSKYLNPSKTLAIDSSVFSKNFNHENYVALKVKDAIVDQQREVFGKRSNIDTEFPDLMLNVYISDTLCTISLDSSGDSLHKRGYRIGQGIAPINEVLAAGLILLSGWRGETNFVDPMCGSGTLLMEAATIAYNIAPGLKIKLFGFMNWDDFDAELWNNVRKNAIAQQKDFEHKIIGFDESPKAIRITKDNVKNAELGWKILLKTKPIEELKREDLPESGVAIINPPYGERMEEDEIMSFYKIVGDCLKSNFDGFDVWIISSNRPALKKIGLRPSRKIPIYNGTLECRFQKYEMYKGTRKAKYLNNNVEQII